MKPYFLYLLLCLYGHLSFAQSSEVPTVAKRQFSYHILTGLSYELAVSPKNTLRFSGPLMLGNYFEKKDYNNYLHLTLRPMLQTEYRYYYNLQKRAVAGKKTTHNSGNFIAPVLQLFGPVLAQTGDSEFYDIEAVAGGLWGIQRNYGKRFNFQVSIGPGIGIAEDEVNFVPMAAVSLGFRLTP